MPEKIVNSMLHGSLKTKIFLWSVVVLAFVTIILLIFGIIFGNIPMIVAAVVAAFVALILSQSVSLNDTTREKKPKKNEQKSAKAPVADRVNQTDGHAEKKDPTDSDHEEKSRREREREKAGYLSSLTEKKIKKLMREHKVNQVHVKVMIDSFPAKKIEQSPAFMWRTDTKLHFLIMTGQAEEFAVPLENIKGILLVKNVPADLETDYAFFKLSSVISDMFSPYLPEYFESSKDGKLEVRKNTFRIEPGIYLTNSSVANVRRVLLPGVAFLVDDGVIASKRFNEYFKELYRHSVLCQNLVITLEEYHEQIQVTLNAMLDAPMSGKEFVTTIQDLSKYKLISQQDAALYTQKYRALKMGQ